MPSARGYGVLSCLVAAAWAASLPPLGTAGLLLAGWLALGGLHTLHLLRATGQRDLQLLVRFLRLLATNWRAQWADQTVGGIFLDTAERLQDKAMVVVCREEGEDRITFREAKEMSCRVAHYFRQQGYRKGDVVALVMENRVDYCCYWIGLSMVGVIPALVNTNLRQRSLLHTITVAKARAVIFSTELAPAISEVKDALLGAGVAFFTADAAPIPGALALPQETSDLPTSAPPPAASYTDTLMYIYTSGTTGLPKAAVLKHCRFIFMAHSLSICSSPATEQDVVYSPLPFYHSAATVLATGLSLTLGSTLVSRRKFSARSFWPDCCAQGVTCAQYIGEIARYLCAAPGLPEESMHRVRMVFGNGLRPQVWQQFVGRFRIQQVNEFYGSTEGNCGVVNFSNKVGAVGFVSVLVPWVLPLGLVRVDPDTLELARDPATGLCLPCRPGEPGELVGKVQRGHPVRDFQGYTDREATNKKLVTDVWRKGDLGFRSGDILTMDPLGWLSFRDRAGDTFRWKGENVSTTEVEAVVSAVVGLASDCVAYGVAVPGTDGRAGMVAIPDPDRLVQVDSLYVGLAAQLPPYARPIFVRLVERVDVTGTYKLKKRDLQSQGFDPDLVGEDALLVLDLKQQKYVDLDVNRLDSINNGNTRF